MVKACVDVLKSNKKQIVWAPMGGSKSYNSWIGDSVMMQKLIPDVVYKSIEKWVTLDPYLYWKQSVWNIELWKEKLSWLTSPFWKDVATEERIFLWNTEDEALFGDMVLKKELMRFVDLGMASGG